MFQSEKVLPVTFRMGFPVVDITVNTSTVVLFGMTSEPLMRMGTVELRLLIMVTGCVFTNDPLIGVKKRKEKKRVMSKRLSISQQSTALTLRYR